MIFALISRAKDFAPSHVTSSAGDVGSDVSTQDMQYVSCDFAVDVGIDPENADHVTRRGL